MKHTLYSTALAAVIASTNVSAEGFAPWPSHAPAEGVQVTVSHTAAPHAFYSAGLPRRTDVRDVDQRVVRTTPFYLTSR